MIEFYEHDLDRLLMALRLLEEIEDDTPVDEIKRKAWAAHSLVQSSALAGPTPMGMDAIKILTELSAHGDELASSLWEKEKEIGDANGWDYTADHKIFSLDELNAVLARVSFEDDSFHGCLLKKYIKHIQSVEGSDFIESARHSDVEFTEGETEALRLLAK